MPCRTGRFDPCELSKVRSLPVEELFRLWRAEASDLPILRSLAREQRVPVDMHKHYQQIYCGDSAQSVGSRDIVVRFPASQFDFKKVLWLCQHVQRQRSASCYGVWARQNYVCVILKLSVEPVLRSWCQTGALRATKNAGLQVCWFHSRTIRLKLTSLISRLWITS